MNRTRSRLLSCLALFILGGSVEASGCASTVAEEEVRSSVSSALVAGQSVLTHHNDNQRTGSFTAETHLTPANVRPGAFDRLYTRYVDGMTFGQPLYAHGVNVGGAQKNLVIVTTRNNKVYAFDADATSGQVRGDWVWLADFLQIHNAGLNRNEGAGFIPQQLPNAKPTALLSQQAGCGEQRGPVGITSTPVIDPSTGILYVIVRASDYMGRGGNDDPVYLLHALDITTGHDVANSPVVLQAPNLDPTHVQNRPALLLSNGTVYIALGSLACDRPPYHGFVLAYDARTLAQTAVFNTTPAGNGGGIWQSGNGPAADAAGNLYLLTGNSIGTDNNNVCTPAAWSSSDLGNSLLKLSANLSHALPVYPTGQEWSDLECGDVDIGSGGPLLLPGGKFVGGGKQGKLFVISETAWDNAHATVFQAFQNRLHPEIPASNYQLSEKCGPNIHVGLVYLKGASGGAAGRVFGMPEKEHLEAFNYDGTTLGQTPVAASAMAVPDGMPGAALSLSSNDGANGIVWASMPKSNGQWSVVNGRLVAFDASTMQELWRDDDDIAFAKFVPPTIADGKVFRATGGNALIVYGATTTPHSTCLSIADKYTAAGGEWSLGLPVQAAQQCNAAGDSCTQDFAGDLAAPLQNVRPSLGDIGSSRIQWTKAACAHIVTGAIHDMWIQPAVGTALGFPTGDEQDGADTRTTFTVRTQSFQNGAAYFFWRFRNDLENCMAGVPYYGACDPRGSNAPAGQRCVPHPKILTNQENTNLTVEIHGRIYNRWTALGAEAGEMGYPISSQVQSPIDANYVQNDFEFGRIYWHSVAAPNDTIEVHGAIYDKYVSYAANANPFGLPLADQQAVTDYKGKGGQMSVFASGAIVWTAAGGAFGVHGALYNAWKAQGGVASNLGFPTSDEVATATGAYNDFEYGRIAWASANGVLTFTYHP